MSLNLLKRAEKGSALTETEHDVNFTAIENEVNSKLTEDNITTGTLTARSADVDFSGGSAGYIFSVQGDGHAAFSAPAAAVAGDLLTAIKTVDGTGSGLDADLVDGNHASAFALSSHTHLAAAITDAGTAITYDAGSTIGDLLLIADNGSGSPAIPAGTDVSLCTGFPSTTYIPLALTPQTGTTDSPATATWTRYSNVGSIAVTLDSTLVDAGECEIVKGAGSGTITVSPGGGFTINGAGSSLVLKGVATVKRNGTNFVVTGDTSEAKTLYGAITFDSTANLGDNQLSRAELKDVSETAYNAGTVSGAVTLDYTNGSYQYMTTGGSNISSLTINNPPASGTVGTITLEITQGATARTWAWGAAFTFPGGTDFSLTASASAVDIFTFVTRNAGTTWRGFEGGYAFAT